MNDQATTTLKYLSGFGSHHESEALEGALPVGQSSPQNVPFGLYAEQISGSAFTAPRAHNLRSWLYRLRPSAMHKPFRRVGEGQIRTAPCHEAECSPNRLRWGPFELPEQPTDFIAGLATLATCGDLTQLATISDGHLPIALRAAAMNVSTACDTDWRA